VKKNYEEPFSSFT